MFAIIWYPLSFKYNGFPHLFRDVAHGLSQDIVRWEGIVCHDWTLDEGLKDGLMAKDIELASFLVELSRGGNLLYRGFSSM